MVAWLDAITFQGLCFRGAWTAGGNMSTSNIPGDIRGEKFLPAQMVEYQDGAVVSREIVRGEAGTVSIFAFDSGEGLSTHTAPFDALVEVIEGSADITIGEETISMQSGELIIMPAGVPHSLRAPEPFKMLLTLIRR